MDHKLMSMVAEHCTTRTATKTPESCDKQGATMTMGCSEDRRGVSRHHSSKDVSSDGCCLAKIFLSNVISFATRSKRKGVNEERCRPARGMLPNGNKNATSCSHPFSCKRKALSEMGVCDSYDGEMLKSLTALPPGMDCNEWLATHTLSLFENVNALCGTISELCTPVSCPNMSYPGVPKAVWIDEKKKQHPYSAMQYIDCALSFCETSSKDEQVYPTKHGFAFADNFKSHCRRLMKLLWHSCGHLYANHWEQLACLNLRTQFSLVLAHMHSISTASDLLDSKELLALSHTLQLVRPTTIHTCSHQSMKLIDGVSVWTQFPPSKSGSWGGNASTATLTCKPLSLTC